MNQSTKRRIAIEFLLLVGSISLILIITLTDGYFTARRNRASFDRYFDLYNARLQHLSDSVDRVDPLHIVIDTNLVALNDRQLNNIKDNWHSQNNNTTSTESAIRKNGLLIFWATIIFFIVYPLRLLIVAILWSIRTVRTPINKDKSII